MKKFNNNDIYTMRKFLLLFTMLLASVAYGQGLSLPIDFESASPYTFTNFDGGAATVIANPGSAGINTSDSVAQMVKGPGGQPWGGAFLDLAAPIDFTTNKIFKVKVWSPRAGARLLLKVEDSNNPATNFEKEDTVSTASAWEELTFDYSSISTSNTYDRIVFIFDLGVAGDGSANFTFFFDDVQLTAGGGTTLTQVDLPITFDDPTVDYTVTDFGGNASQVVVDPTNPANMVCQSEKTAAAQLWAGTTASTANGLASAIPFTATETEMTVRVWSPDANIPVRLKVEDKTNPTISCETEAMTVTAGGWDTLVFDFSNEAAGTAALNIANTYDMVSIFFNFGTDGATAGAKTYYWDDVWFGMPTGVVLSQIDLPVTFEDSTVDYTMTDFGGNASQVVTDPTNANNTVAEVEKTAASQTWAGTTISTPLGFASAIPFTATDTKISVRVWSPTAGTPIRLKVEDASDPNISVETETNTTVASAWETLEFDFSNEVSGTSALDLNNTYDLASIFFNFGTDGATAGATTYYFDDVEFVTATGIAEGDISGLSYYPNPVQNRLNIRADQRIENVRVFNTLGQEVLNLTPNTQEVIADMANFKAGVYVFVATVDGKTQSFNILKQ